MVCVALKELKYGKYFMASTRFRIKLDIFNDLIPKPSYKNKLMTLHQTVKNWTSSQYLNK